MNLSVIVPAYNAEKTISRCLESICSQVEESIIREIIVINDGSSDNTEKIVESYVNKNPKVRLINKQNGGVSSARNIGIEAAKGDLIMFVDADDQLTPVCCKTLFDAITNNACDMVMCGYQLQSGKTSISRIPISNMCGKVTHIRDCFIYFFENLFLNAPWGKIFWRNKIKILFDEKLQNGEDIKFVLDYLRENPFCIGVSQSLYVNHADCENSLSRNRLYALEATAQTQMIIGGFINDIKIANFWNDFSDYCISLIWTNIIDGKNLKQFSCEKGYDSIKWTSDYYSFLGTLTPQRKVNIIINKIIKYKGIALATFGLMAQLKRISSHKR